MSKVTVDSEKCCGCRICEMACSMIHLQAFNPRKALLRVEIDRSLTIAAKPSEIDVPVVCLQCESAPCADVCPTGAIGKTTYGAWVVEAEKCTGCGVCVENCSYGMIVVDAGEETARKCDLCQGSPSCVQYCPTQALTFEESQGG